MKGNCYKSLLKDSFLGFTLRHSLLLQHQEPPMVKVIKTLTMKWVLDGSRRVELIDNGVADKIAYNKSGGDVLHCTAREGDGSLRCIYQHL